MDDDIEEKSKCQIKTKELFDMAIKEDNSNPDFYRNYAVFLATMGKKDECYSKLMLAKNLSDGDILLADFMELKRLQDLFRSAQDYYTDEIKEMLGKEFDIKFDETGCEL